MTSPLLDVANLSVEFNSQGRRVQAIRDLNLSIAPGETLAVVGESGSGKSVTAMSVMRLIEREGGFITSGSITFDQGDGPVDLLKLNEKALRRIRGNAISMIFQEPMTSLNPVLRIGDQLVEVLQLHRGLGGAAALAEAKNMLDRVRMPEAARRLTQYPHELSGGTRQRVMIAMALLCRPRLLIADEPTTALDVTVQAQILGLIHELQKDMNMAVMFITHDLGVVAEIADRVAVMHFGAMVENANAADLYANPQRDYTKKLIAAVPRLGQQPSPAPLAKIETPVLSVRGLTKRYPIRKGVLKSVVGNVHAVENVSFDLMPGETLALVGESGCGKSTTGRVLMKLAEPTNGNIRIGGRDITKFKAGDMQPVRRDVQMIFQDPYASLNPRLTALDSITEPLVIHEPTISVRERRTRAATLLRRVGLQDEHLDRYPHQFSGGQRQRLAIARALCLGPRVIVADEPVSALDVSVQAQVLDLMNDIQQERGVSYLFISHDLAVVERVSHRVAVMYLGQIVEIGPTAAVLHQSKHPYTKRLLASVPIADPARRRAHQTPDASELPSPIRQIGDAPKTPALVEVGPGHFVQQVA